MNGWILYLLISLSISLTSYITIFKPSVDLLLEITEDETVIQNSILFKVLWLLAATVLAPIMGIVLLSGKNKTIIRDLVLSWSGTEDE